MNSPKLIAFVVPMLVTVFVCASNTQAQSVEPSPARLALQSQIKTLESHKTVDC